MGKWINRTERLGVTMVVETGLEKPAVQGMVGSTPPHSFPLLTVLVNPLGERPHLLIQFSQQQFH